MKKYTRITLEGREKVYLLKKQDLNISSIAKELGRNQSTVSRELKRCFQDPLGYIPDRAHNLYLKGWARNKALFLDKPLQDYVITKLVNSRWTPKEISASLRLRNDGMKACPETIYQFIRE